MKELAKWCWVIFIGLIAFGWWFFLIAGVAILLIIIIHILRPEWLEDDKENRQTIKKKRLEEAKVKRYKRLIREEKYPENCIALENTRNGIKTVDLYWLTDMNQSNEASYYEDKLIRVDFKLARKIDAIVLVLTMKTDDIKTIKWNESYINGCSIDLEGFSKEDIEKDDKLELNKATLRTIMVSNKIKHTNTLKEIKKAEWGSDGIRLRLKLVYKDNISDIINLKLKVNHFKEQFNYVDKRPKTFIGDELLPEIKEKWLTYVTKNNVHYDKNSAFVVSRIINGHAVLMNVIDVPKGTPVILKECGNKQAKIIKEDVEFNYTNLLKVSDESTNNGVYIMANKSKGIGFYVWNGGLLGSGKVYLFSKDSNADGYIDLYLQ